MPTRPVLLALCVLIAVLALPLAFELVAPNPWYGLRPVRTASDPLAWYECNLIAGALAIEGALVAAAAVCFLPERLLRRHPWATFVTFVLAVSVLLASAAAFLWSLK